MYYISPKFEKKSLEKKSIALFSAHPDDVEIGMAGTVNKLVKMDYEVNHVIVTIPAKSEEIIKIRRQEAIEASKIMGCNKPIFLDLPPLEFRFERKIVNLLDKMVKDLHPDSVFCPFVGDTHQDHQFLTKALMSCARYHSDLCMYETMIPGGITDRPFRAQLFVDVSETIDSKRSALECHKTQADRLEPNWIDSVISRCSSSGFQLQKKYAEAFEIIRMTKW